MVSVSCKFSRVKCPRGKQVCKEKDNTGTRMNNSYLATDKFGVEIRRELIATISKVLKPSSRNNRGTIMNAF